MKAVAALMLLGLPVVLGALGGSPWLLIPLAMVFTLNYAVGKKAAWVNTWEHGGPLAVIGALAVTLPIQAVVASVFYGIPAGIRWAMGGAFSPVDPLQVGGVVLIGGLAALIGSRGGAPSG